MTMPLAADFDLYNFGVQDVLQDTANGLLLYDNGQIYYATNLSGIEKSVNMDSPWELVVEYVPMLSPLVSGRYSSVGVFARTQDTNQMYWMLNWVNGVPLLSVSMFTPPNVFNFNYFSEGSPLVAGASVFTKLFFDGSQLHFKISSFKEDFTEVARLNMSGINISKLGFAIDNPYAGDNTFHTGALLKGWDFQYLY